MTSDSTGEAPIHPQDYPGPSKGLVLLVKVLGIILVLLFLALIGGIIWKATHKSAPAPVADVVMDLGLDPATIKHMELDGTSLVLATDKEVLVIDIKQRKVMLRSLKP